ncbi:MAG: glycosyltransferase family 39 protein [Proteobacteria bacterium]|nr:glycosyltransferase family 39 protein [Pseudomonadota bacterium]
MNSDLSTRRFTIFLWIALAITLLRIVYLFINQRDLDIEENQYWVWSQNLAWGYHSKPPLISWIIHLSTWLFGNNAWAIRFFCPIIYLLSASFIYGCGQALYDSKVAFWAGLTILLLPGVTYSATILSTDPLLLFFWSAGLYCLIQAGKSGKLLWWLLLGAAIGLGVMSKYTMLVFILSAGLYFIWDFRSKVIIQKWQGVYSLLVAFAFFSPNLFWNLQHHDAALNHVVNHNMLWDRSNLFHFKNLMVFLLEQAGIIGPILFIFIIPAWLQKNNQKTDTQRLLLCFTLPMLILIMGQAVVSRAYANWAVAAYPSGVLLIVAYLCQKSFTGWLKASLVVNIAIAVWLMGWELAIAYGYCHWPLAAHPSWVDFGRIISQQQAKFPNREYLVDNRELWSRILYYGKIPMSKVLIWDPENIQDWSSDAPKNSNQIKGGHFIFVTYSDHLPTSMLKCLGDYQKITHIKVNQRLRTKPADINLFSLINLQFPCRKN